MEIEKAKSMGLPTEQPTQQSRLQRQLKVINQFEETIQGVKLDLLTEKNK